MDQFMKSFESLGDFLEQAPASGLHLIYIIDIRPEASRGLRQHLNWVETEALYRAAMESLATRAKHWGERITWFVPNSQGQKTASFLDTQRALFDNPGLADLIPNGNAFNDARTTTLTYAVGIDSRNAAEYALTWVVSKRNPGPSYNINGKPMFLVSPTEPDSMAVIFAEFVRATAQKEDQCRGWDRLSLKHFLGYPALRAFRLDD